MSANHHFHSWGKPLAVAGTAKDIAAALPEDGWQRRSVDEGTRGARRHDWADLELADLNASDLDAAFPGIWTRGLLIRCSIADGALAFFSTWCPAGTSIKTLALAEGRRWVIEDTFETARSEFDLDHSETRSWPGWHRHVSLVVLAFAMVADRRHHANAALPPKKYDEMDAAAPPLIRWSVQEIRHIATRIARVRIEPSHVLAWSLWRRAHQAAAR